MLSSSSVLGVHLVSTEDFGYTPEPCATPDEREEESSISAFRELKVLFFPINTYHLSAITDTVLSG